MAIEICADCNNQISSSAKVCPHCGRPVKKNQFWNFSSACGTLGCAVLAIIFLLIFLLFFIPFMVQTDREADRLLRESNKTKVNAVSTNVSPSPSIAPTGAPRKATK